MVLSVRLKPVSSNANWPVCVKGNFENGGGCTPEKTTNGQADLLVMTVSSEGF